MLRVQQIANIHCAIVRTKAQDIVLQQNLQIKCDYIEFKFSMSKNPLIYGHFTDDEKNSNIKTPENQLLFVKSSTTIFCGIMSYKAVKITTFCVFLLTDQRAYAIV
jgi:hypothetical protein